MRLQTYLAQAGVASRRASEAFIRAGRVSVNGQVVTTMGWSVQTDDRVCVDGRPVTREPLVYIMLYKPGGVVTTASDPQGRPTVLQSLPLTPRIYPVGRLDFQTTGLLLLTNDGELAARLMHPRYQVPKTYIATVKGEPSSQALERLRKGVLLADGKTAPARVELHRTRQDTTDVLLTLHEGRKREVRRMLHSVGHRVVHLHRCEYAGLTLGGLKPGAYRTLRSFEVAKLRAMTGMETDDG